MGCGQNGLSDLQDCAGLSKNCSALQELLVVYREAEPPNRVELLKKRLPNLPNFQGDKDDKEQESSPDKPALRSVLLSCFAGSVLYAVHAELTSTPQIGIGKDVSSGPCEQQVWDVTCLGLHRLHGSAQLPCPKVYLLFLFVSQDLLHEASTRPAEAAKSGYVEVFF